MAYLNFTEIHGGTSEVRTHFGAAAVTPRTGFSALEWQVIALAQRDSLSTLQAPGRVTSALETVFGFKSANPELANPALETLRRVSVLAWHRGFALPQSQIDAFHDAGYSEDQLETLLGSIAAGRIAAKRKAFS